jgi:hypothetical protein
VPKVGHTCFIPYDPEKILSVSQRVKALKALFSNRGITFAHRWQKLSLKRLLNLRSRQLAHAENIVIRFEAVNNGKVTVIYQSFRTL